MSITGLSGSLSGRSRTKSLVATLVRHLEARLSVPGQVIDLAEGAEWFWPARQPQDLPAEAQSLFRQVAESDLLVVGTPVYKGAYSGLFKHFFDLLDRDALLGKTVLLAATGGGQQHALILEHHLRPLFSQLGAYTVPVGIYASESDFIDYEVANPALQQRIERAVDQAVDLVSRLGGFKASELAAPRLAVAS